MRECPVLSLCCNPYSAHLLPTASLLHIFALLFLPYLIYLLSYGVAWVTFIMGCSMYFHHQSVLVWFIMQEGRKEACERSSGRRASSRPGKSKQLLRTAGDRYMRAAVALLWLHLPAFPVAQPLQARLTACPATTPPWLREGWDVSAADGDTSGGSKLEHYLVFQPSPVSVTCPSPSLPTFPTRLILISGTDEET